MDAYTLSDRGTWLSFTNKGSLVVAIEGDPRLINRYDVIELSRQKHPTAKLPSPRYLRTGSFHPKASKPSARIR
jgi:tungstate transport system substrate-binding protein